MDKNLYDLPPEELSKIPTVCGSLREALDNLDKNRDFLKKGGVFTDDMIDAYIELKMAEVQALRDDAASGRVRHVLLGLIDRADCKVLGKGGRVAALSCFRSCANPGLNNASGRD